MLENFTMVITQKDFLRIVNAGIRDLTWGTLVEKETDRVDRIQYSRSSKQYTLIFTSGKSVKVAKK